VSAIAHASMKAMLTSLNGVKACPCDYVAKDSKLAQLINNSPVYVDSNNHYTAQMAADANAFFKVSLAECKADAVKGKQFSEACHDRMYNFLSEKLKAHNVAALKSDSDELEDEVEDFALIKKSFDSYMVLEEDLEIGQHRLLETDNRLYLPS